MLPTKLIKVKGSSGECDHSIVKPTQRFKNTFQIFLTFLQWDRENSFNQLLLHLCLSLPINFIVALVTINYGFKLLQKTVKIVTKTYF